MSENNSLAQPSPPEPILIDRIYKTCHRAGFFMPK